MIFWAVFGPLWPLFDHFWPDLGLDRTFLEHFRTKIGSLWGDLAPFLVRSGVVAGSLKDRFAIVLASFRARFRVVLSRFWVLFGPFSAHFFVLPILEQLFWSYCGFFFVLFWWCFGKLTVTSSDMMEEKWKNMQILAKLHQDYAKLCKSKRFLRL